MSELDAIAAITTVGALILVGSAIMGRRLDWRSTLGLAGIWLAIIVLGMIVARLWIAHQS